ncbi:MAG: hypothetical protein AB1921_11265 [Thermodesulfobacteriota bacterium]
MKRLFAALVAALVIFSGVAYAQQEEGEMVIMEEGKLPWELNTWLVRTVCANGHVFFVSYVLGRSAGAAVSSTQVMEEKDGKTVPMRCDQEKLRKERAKKVAQQPATQQ